MLLNLFANKYTYTPAAAFSAGVNVLPEFRKEAENKFPACFPTGWEAQIRGVRISGAAAFEVSFSDTDIVTAEETAGGGYELFYNGDIKRAVFSAQTTASSVTLWFSRAPKSHFDVTISAPDGASISAVTDGRGNAYVKSSDQSYELCRGLIYVTASGGGYDVENYPVAITGESGVLAEIPPVRYTVAFSVTPEGAAVSLKDKNGAEMPHILGNPYIFKAPNSTAAGGYSYTVSAPGYVDKTESLSVTADQNVTAALLWDVSQSGDGSIGASVLSGALTISGGGAMRDFSESSPAPWRAEGGDITSVSVSAAVSKIGAYAFWGLSGITALTLGGAGNAVLEIGENALLDTTALSSCTVYTSGGEALSGDPFGAAIEITYAEA